MRENNIKILSGLLPDRFASFFHNNIVKLLNEVTIEEDVYIGTNKAICSGSYFMDLESVVTCMKSLKSKNSEGYDRIPQRILVDGVDILSVPMQKLMSLIYIYGGKDPRTVACLKDNSILKNKGQ